MASTHYGMHFRSSNNSSYLLSIYSVPDPALNALHTVSGLIRIVVHAIDVVDCAE